MSFRKLVEAGDWPWKKGPLDPSMQITVKSDTLKSKEIVTKLPGEIAVRGPSQITMPDDPAVHAALAQHGQSLFDHPDFVQDIDTEVPAAVDLGFLEPVPPTNTDLPAVINRDLERTDQHFGVVWYPVRRLPGYVIRIIRVMGQRCFSQFTQTPIEQMHVCCTLTNSATEVQRLVKWLTQYGKQVDSAHLDFTDVIPGYEADVRIFEVSGFQFAVVKDFAGYYVYGWAHTGGGRKVFDPVHRRYLPYDRIPEE